MYILPFFYVPRFGTKTFQEYLVSVPLIITTSASKNIVRLKMSALFMTRDKLLIYV